MNNFMKNLLLSLLLLSGFAAAQVTYTSPQGVQSVNFFNAVSTAQTSPCLPSLGQTVQIANYIVSGGTPSAIQFRLEYSYDSDAATCTTGTWFQMSDDATDLTQGEVVGIGSYPFVRANLVQCVACGGGVTVSASYSATSAAPGIAYGFYNPSQQFRKIIFTRLAGNLSQTTSGIPAPYGSAAGFILFNTTNSLVGGQIQATIHYGGVAFTLSSFSVPTAPLSGYTIAIPMPAIPATSIDVSWNGGAAANRFITATYYFYPPGEAQPYGAQPASSQQLNNNESTSLANSTVTTNLEIPIGAVISAHLFSVAARCSAGTAQLTVADGGTTDSLTGSRQIFSTSATEVGTTTFHYQWNPGLRSSPGNGLSISLGTCGVGNVGTLDVQGSSF